MMLSKTKNLLAFLALSALAAFAAQSQQPTIIQVGKAAVSASFREMPTIGTDGDTSAPAPSGPTSAEAVIGINIDGTPSGANADLDASPNGSVGGTQYVQWTNSQVAVYNKSNGALVWGPVAASSFWSGVGGPCLNSQNNGDGIIEFDKIASRWVITHHATDGQGNWFQCFAISTTSDATGTYYLSDYEWPWGSNTYFPDYVKLGVWPDAYYLTVDQEQLPKYTNVNVVACAFDRANMLKGNSYTAQCFSEPDQLYGHSFLPADLDGSTLPPAGSPNYFMNLGTNALNLWKFSVNWQDPSKTQFVGPQNIAVNAFTLPCNNGGNCPPQPNTNQHLDSVGERLMNRLVYRNFPGVASVLLVSHAVSASGRTGVRWYVIAYPNRQTPVVQSQGTFSPDANSRWMSSMAMDKVGDIVLGYRVSSSTVHPSVSFTGRKLNDVHNQMIGETSIFEGSGSQNSAPQWGPYTSMAIEPQDDCTFWYTNEYLPSDGIRNWRTRIASMKFPNCH